MIKILTIPDLTVYKCGHTRNAGIENYVISERTSRLFTMFFRVKVLMSNILDAHLQPVWFFIHISILIWSENIIMWVRTHIQNQVINQTEILLSFKMQGFIFILLICILSIIVVPASAQFKRIRANRIAIRRPKLPRLSTVRRLFFITEDITYRLTELLKEM